MAGRIAARFIDALLARLDITDVVGSRIPLKRAGRELSARCPFHDERTPSFYVSPQKQFFHCFGCGASGDAVRFVMRYEGLDFVDAIETLAQNVGLAVQYEAGRSRDAGLELLLEVLRDAAIWFREQLQQHAEGRAYFQQRGVDAAAIQRFGLGWAPGDGQALAAAIGRTTERKQALLQAGLTGSSRGDDWCKFRSRVMFPIHDRRGRAIAFGGRVLDSSEPKYLNSPESPVFHKSRELYGLHEARQAHSHLQRLLVVEGYLDVIALAQAGITEAVATLGTATSRDHAEVLFRSAPEVVFCFDGDKAGRAAAWRALTHVLPRMTEGREARFLFLPDGEDPDTLVRQEGESAFRARLQGAMPLSAYFFRELGQQTDSNTLEGRAKLIALARPLLQTVPDSAFRDLMLAELERVGGTPVRLQAPEPARNPSTETRSTARTPSTQKTLVRHLLSLLLAKPDLALMAGDLRALQWLDKPGLDVLQRVITQVQLRPGVNPPALLASLAEDPAIDALSRLAMLDPPGDPELWPQEFESGLTRLLREARQARIAALQQQLGEAELSPAERTELRELLAEKGRTGL